MNIHFFQRYHTKENVDTANAMLLLSRLYSNSSTEFFAFLNKFIPGNINGELVFTLQEKGKASVPDATIAQSSFKIIVETKISGGFGIEQLEKHLMSFEKEESKILLTLAPEPMKLETNELLKKSIDAYCHTNNINVIHTHLTFEELVNYVNDVIDERDYEMMNIYEDYKDYCYNSNLIRNYENIMRVKTSGTTIDINKQLNLHYDSESQGFSGHEYLGLYNQKAVRAIGKIIAIATVEPKENTPAFLLLIDNLSVDDLSVKVEKGELTNEMKTRIIKAIIDSKKYGYSLLSKPHRFFFVDKFYDTFYEKFTPNPLWHTKLFDLTKVLEIPNLPSTAEIAELLRKKKW